MKHFPGISDGCDICGKPLAKQCWSLAFPIEIDETLTWGKPLPDAYQVTVVHYHSACVPKGLMRYLIKTRNTKIHSRQGFMINQIPWRQ